MTHQERWSRLAEDLDLPHPCAGCDRPAVWAATAPTRTVYACADHLGELLDSELVWFVQALSQR